MPRIKTCEELCFNPSRPDLGWRQKISLNFYFPSFLRCFKSFYDGLKGIWTYFTPCSSVSVVNFWAGKCQLGWVQTIPPQNLKLNYCHLSDWILLEISQGDYLAWKLQLLTSGSWTMLIYKEFSPFIFLLTFALIRVTRLEYDIICTENWRCSNR